MVPGLFDQALVIIFSIGFDKSLDRARIRAYYGGMQTLPISKVKDRLNEFVDAVSLTHEQVTITKNGSPAAVLIGADEWESLQETLFWLSRPGTINDVADARRELAEGRTVSEDEIRAEFNVPRRIAK
ncbi:type II toxin-antitoxin system Phd/YefM family antitoxin [Subtercola vilae]|nr:type II toxin-antitoxin system Phd/YefM family antitoxin [Subtercola vilae]